MEDGLAVTHGPMGPPVVVVAADGRFSLDGETLSYSDLVAKLAAALDATGGKHVVFDLASAAADGAVRSAIDAAKQAGASRFEIKKPTW